MKSKSPLYPKLTYRPDIDGLCAFTVLSVVIFHINEEALSGGFLGIDIFFLLSGFLITQLLIKDINRDGKYLWHWPLLASARYAFLGINLLTELLIFGGTFLLAALSYYIVEKPITAARAGAKNVFSRYLIAPTAMKWRLDEY